jgi:hypothetical protein
MSLCSYTKDEDYGAFSLDKLLGYVLNFTSLELDKGL